MAVVDVKMIQFKILDNAFCKDKYLVSGRKIRL